MKDYLGSQKDWGLGTTESRMQGRFQRLLKSPKRSDKAVEQEMERKRCIRKILWLVVS